MAPMAGVTDEPFRSRLRRNGCRALWTEMVSAAALVRNHRATLAMVDTRDIGDDTAIQLFGSKPDELAVAAQIICALGWRRVDINMGCPVKKVVKTGSGAAMMRDVDNAARCVEAVRVCSTGIVTVKMRLGWTLGEQNFLELAQKVSSAGADAVILHARTRSQGYSGEADWDKIDQLAGSIPVPIAGNGDITTALKAVEMLADHPVSAVMLGRAPLGEPWIFRDAHLIAEGKAALEKPGPGEIAEDLALQFNDLRALKGDRCAVAEIKKFIAWSVKGHKGAAGFRNSAMRLTDVEGINGAFQVISKGFDGADDAWAAPKR